MFIMIPHEQTCKGLGTHKTLFYPHVHHMSHGQYCPIFNISFVKFDIDVKAQKYKRLVAKARGVASLTPQFKAICKLV